MSKTSRLNRFLAISMMILPFSAQAHAPLTLPVAGDPTISFSVWFKIGSQNDPPGKEGLAMLTGALLADGATSENSYEDILKKLFPIASSYNSRVDREMTTLSGRTHVDNVEAFLKLFTDAYTKPAFQAADFERLRQDQRNALEKTLRFASEEELGKAALHFGIFAGTPYAHPVLGTVAGLKAITLDDVKAFYRQHYNRNNSVIALGGGYGPDVLKRFQSSIAALPDGQPTPAPTIAAKPLTGRQVLFVDKPGADASISFGFPAGVKRGERDFYALWLATSWLGEHRNSSSHLYQVIRETRGLNYGDYAYIEAYPEAGQRQMPPANVGRRHQLFEVWIRTLPNDNAVFALRAALREMKRLLDVGLTEEEFQLTRAFLKKYSLHYAPTTQTRLGYRIDDLFYGVGGDGHLAQFGRMMDDLTRDQVNAAIKKHWQLDNLQIAIVTGETENLRKVMTEDLPSPPSYATPKAQEILDEDQVIMKFPLKIDPAAVRVVPIAEIFER